MVDELDESDECSVVTGIPEDTVLKVEAGTLPVVKPDDTELKVEAGTLPVVVG